MTQTPADPDSPTEDGAAAGTEAPAGSSASEEPTTAQLQEPSTEKEPHEEPKAPKKNLPEPDHEAVGIGVIGRPQFDPDDTAEPDDAPGSDDAADPDASSSTND